MAPLLEVSGLRKEFTLHMLGARRLQAFADVDLTVNRKECLLLRGPSGAGKSSLLKCLYRTYRPSGGRALLRAGGGVVDLAAVSDREVLALRRASLGYVSQFFHAIPRLTALSVVAEPLRELGVDPDDAVGRARELLARLQIPERLWDGYPATFSGGERQRVNLARALIVPRDLILLDEPTASLDPERARVVLEWLAGLKREGAALIAVFHEPDPPSLVDRVHTLREAAPWTA